MVIKMVNDVSERRRYLDGPCDSRGLLECCSGSFGLQHPERLGGQDGLFSTSARWRSFWTSTPADPAISTSKSNDAGSEAAIRKGALLVGDTVNMLFAPGLKTQYFSSLVTDLVLTYRLEEWTTNEPVKVRSFRTTLEVAAELGLFEALPACVQQSLAAGGPLLLTRGCRSKNATSGPTTISSRSTKSGTRGLRFRLFVYFEKIDTLSTDGAERFVVLGLVDSALHGFLWSSSTGANSSRLAQARLLEELRSAISQRGTRSARPEAGEGIEVVRVCPSDQDGRAAATAATVSKATSSRRRAT